ncbi:TPA: NrdH-redoxin [Candidatus Woesearchaeota archaeon]|nr:NrdH-redoxin [Candidatus Woesearchaeota archaeon]
MEIKIFIRPTDPWSQKLKELLKKKKLSFLEFDLSESSESVVFRDEVLQNTGQIAVPVISIDNEWIVGFQEKKIEELLNKKSK